MVVSEAVLDKVVLHPPVLLSVADHFSRMGKIGNQKRVVGLLLGSWASKGVLDFPLRLTRLVGDSNLYTDP